jgi:integrase
VDRECVGLQWGDLDFNSKFVTVRRTVTPSGRIEKTTTVRVRRVDMTAELAAALKVHRRLCLENAMKDGKTIPEWVFANDNGKPTDMHNPDA